MFHRVRVPFKTFQLKRGQNDAVTNKYQKNDNFEKDDLKNSYQRFETYFKDNIEPSQTGSLLSVMFYNWQSNQFLVTIFSAETCYFDLDSCFCVDALIESHRSADRM